MPDHPLRAALAEWLPEFDFGVLDHGFAPHGRDYLLIAQVPQAGTFELAFTHVVEQHYETAVGPDVWLRSWDDVLTDYDRWEANGSQPEGYVWGTNWSLAYPGIDLLDDDPAAQRWSTALGTAMFAATVTTDRFKIGLIFHGARWQKLSDDDGPVANAIIPSGNFRGR